MEQQIANLIILGSMYSIVAVGFTLYFGTVNLINFAHGDLCMLGAFSVLILLRLFNVQASSLSFMTFSVVACLAILVILFVGLLSNLGLFRHLRRRPLMEGLIASVALSTLMRELVLHFYPNGGNPQHFPDPFEQTGTEIFGASVSHIQIVLVLVCVMFAAGFFWFVRKTQLGRVMRAVSQDSEAAEMIGLPVERTVAVAFAIGAAFAATAGILGGAMYGSIRYDMGVGLGVKGFVAAIAGGLSSPVGAFFGGMLLASLETFVVATFPGGSAYKDIVAFAVLIAVLVVRPAGLLGKSANAA